MNQTLKRGYLTLLVLLLLVAVVLLVLHLSQSSKPGSRNISQEEFEQLVSRYEDTLARQALKADSLRRSQYRRNYRTNNNPYPSAPRYSREAQPAQINRDTAAHQLRRYEKPTITLDLNNADTLDLQQLRGIGPAYARRICNYRTKLGGFYSKEQLREVYGMTEELYNRVAPHLTIDTTTLVKLNLNAATFKELNNHPYLDYHQVKAIMQYRQKCGKFNKKEDLLKVNLIDQETYNKINPYIML